MGDDFKKQISMKEFLSESPLYKRYHVEMIGHDAKSIEKFKHAKFDCYCKECRKVSTFCLQWGVVDGGPTPIPQRRVDGKLQSISQDGSLPVLGIDLFHETLHIESLSFQCATNHKHRVYIILGFSRDGVQKIGQYPSVSDLMQIDTEYAKLLGEEKSREFKKAIQLHTHDIGAGSLIYLRRVFEYLIDKAGKTASTDGWVKPKDKSMEQIIKSLKEYLPGFVVENRSIYGTVSDGVHNLPEDECIDLFSIVRLGIESCLQETIRKKREEKNQIEFTKAHSEYRTKRESRERAKGNK